MSASGNTYQFSLRTGQNQGLHIQGTITPSGEVKMTKQEQSFNTCPICLAKGTMIATPEGDVPVEQLQPGMPVWTADKSGIRVAGTVIGTGSTPVPVTFQVITIQMYDSRTILASPGHPATDGRALRDYRIGDVLDGSAIVSMDYVLYDGSYTYDLLPSGATGLYWANGILLKSTMSQGK